MAQRRVALLLSACILVAVISAPVLAVCPTITVTKPVIKLGNLWTPFSQTFTQSGGIGTITWSETGVLPAGITLNSSTGVLSGVPTQTGAFPLVVTATDANACFGSVAYTLTIACATPFNPAFPDLTTQPPFVMPSVSPTQVASGGTTTATADYCQRDGHALTFTWSQYKPAVGTVPSLIFGQPNSATTTVTVPQLQVGIVYVLNVRVADGGNVINAKVALPATPAASRFYTVAPCRIIDTRNPVGPYGGPTLLAGASRAVTIGGTCGVPVNANAVALNITAVNPTTSGSLRLYPGAGAAPAIKTSSIALIAGRVRAKVETAGLNSGVLSVRSDQTSGQVDFILDVSGYFR